MSTEPPARPVLDEKLKQETPSPREPCVWRWPPLLKKAQSALEGVTRRGPCRRLRTFPPRLEGTQCSQQCPAAWPLRRRGSEHRGASCCMSGLTPPQSWRPNAGLASCPRAARRVPIKTAGAAAADELQTACPAPAAEPMPSRRLRSTPRPSPHVPKPCIPTPLFLQLLRGHGTILGTEDGRTRWRLPADGNPTTLGEICIWIRFGRNFPR